uniref:Solute carrier family 2 member 6 n=1 Tax=Neolamprologus brichardi TaxID=32507 RepID=A0A3Q4GWB3_NEOBR
LFNNIQLSSRLLLGPEPGSIKNSGLYLAAFAAVLGNFNSGYSLVYPSPVLPYFQSPDADPRLRMNTEQAAWFGSIYSLGAAAGGLGAILLNDMIGRKLSIMMSALPSTIGLVSVYISEISHQKVRGALGSCPQITSVIGALVLYALGLVVPWRWLAVAGEVPAVLMVVLMAFMPSSPRRLLSMGRQQHAERVLRWLRGNQYDPKITWSQLGTPTYYKPILISVGMRFLQQMTGITPILVYMEPIFKKSNVPLYGAAIVGLLRLCSIAVAAFLMDKAGRKALLYTSSMLMFLSTLTLTMVSHTTPCPPGPAPPNHTALDYTSHNDFGSTFMSNLYYHIVGCLLGYALGWGPITWLLMSEVLPLAARGKASGVCVTVSWLTAFGLTHGFTHLVDTYGLYVPYLLFTVVCVVSLLFNAVCIPETRKRSLEEIENYFRTGRTFTINRSS